MVKKKAGSTAGYISLVSFWLSFEYFCLNLDFLSPWMNLGNGLAKDIPFIQWYEYTGVPGGSLWIMLSNILLYLTLSDLFFNKKKKYLFAGIRIVLIAIPSIISLYTFHKFKQPDGKESEIIIVQPNIDPYNEKYSMPFTRQINKAIELAETAVTSRTKWIIMPETLVDDPINEENPDDNLYTGRLKELAKRHPSASIIAGLVSFRSFNGEAGSANNDGDPSGLPLKEIEYYNSAFMIDTSGSAGIYHKSKLVPGIEKQISRRFGKVIRKIIPSLGGTDWGYTAQDERECFTHPATLQKIGPVICYESVFGEFVTGYVKKGAEVLFIITNDGWWKNTRGYKQHQSFASLRAIETRRYVARAANTGISCFIDPRGVTTRKSDWWETTTLAGSVIPENRITFYVRYGDYLLELALVCSVLILIIVYLVVPYWQKKR